ncbi:GntR family transcriptional regulator [Brachyspira sp. SAP_772]|uniref:GntR family transcriptional regulator n=1 Tax=Brachyspira sp. SAP_772 TaxID=2608385 RepID=UPI0012F5269A|nr:GntR family transcriptional regulator [Brachyspira sp. SAP_772]
MSNNFLYKKVYDDILKKINNGVWKRGDRIPKEEDLLKSYNVSRDTLRKALSKLKYEGILYSKSGIATYVKEKKLDYKLASIESFSEISKRENKTPRSIVYRAEKIIPDDDIVNKMELKKNESVFFIERLRLAENKIVCYEKTYINEKLCPDIDKFVSPNTSLFNLYENQYNIKISYGKYTFEAINAPSDMAKILSIKDGDAILMMNATIFTIDNIPLYTVIANYIGSEYIFTTVLQRD